MTSWRIEHGDLFDVLPTLDAESIDACVTDPPYGIGFMGREWDTFSPESIQTAAAMKQRKDPEQLANLKNVYGRKRSPAQSPSQIEYNRSLEGQRSFQGWTERWAREALRVLKPGAHILVCGAPRSFHRMTCGLEDAGFEIRDCLSWLYGQGFPKSLNLGDGRGTALKPGWEPIVLARKHCDGSTTANTAQYGTGGLGIDACRLEVLPDDARVRASRNGETVRSASGYEGGLNGGHTRSGLDLGRWPANVLLDDLAAELLDQQSGELVSGANPTRRGSDKFRDTYGEFKGQETCDAVRGLDVGGASRFYYTAKPSREERDFGCDGLTARQRDDSRKDGNPGGDNPRNRGLQPRGNFHPTVKPVALMRWLVRLVTPTDGCVLDPFLGSGTTGMASRYEQRGFIGIEKEAGYIEIARRRIQAVAPLFSSEASA